MRYKTRRTGPNGAGKECTPSNQPTEVKYTENEYADTLFAGAARPGETLFVPRVRESCTFCDVTKVVGARKHGLSFGKTARVASTSAKMPRGTLLRETCGSVVFTLQLQTVDPARLEIERWINNNPLRTRCVARSRIALDLKTGKIRTSVLPMVILVRVFHLLRPHLLFGNRAEYEALCYSTFYYFPRFPLFPCFQFHVFGLPASRYFLVFAFSPRCS